MVDKLKITDTLPEHAEILQRAFQMLPEDARKVISAANITWKVGAVKYTDFAYPSADSVVISDGHFQPEASDAQMAVIASYIYGIGLHKTLNIQHDKREIHDALRETVLQILLPKVKGITGKDPKKMFGPLLQSEERRLPENIRPAHILAGCYLHATQDPNKLSKTPNRLRLYERYNSA